MTLILKQSTSIDIRVGPFVDATDAVTPETGITLAGADEAEVLKANGAATAAMAGAFVAVTGADGWYDYTVATGDVDTVGEVVFVVQDLSVALPVFVRGYVVEEAVYDAMYGAASAGPLQSTTAGRTLDVAATGEAGLDLDNTVGTLDAAQIGAAAITAAKFAAGAIDAAAIANGAIDAATFATGAIDNAAFNVTETLTANPAAGGIVAGSFGAGAIDAAAIATGAIDADAIAADAVTEIRSLASDTADAGGSTTTMIDAARTEADDVWNGCWIMFTSGAVANQVRLITDFDAASDTTTFAPAVTASIGAGITYEILPAGAVDVQSWLGTVTALAAVNALVSGRVDTSVGAMAANVLTASAINAAAITSAKFGAGAIDNAAFNVTETLTANPASGGIVAASFGAGAIDAAAIAANAIGASELATDAIGDAQIATGAIASTAFAAGAIDNAAFNVTETLTANPAAGGITAASFGAGAIDAAALATDAVTEIRDAILPEQNVALSNIPFLFVAASDHVTPVTGATGTGVTRSIDSAAFGAGTGTLAEVANGIYQYDASAADMNGGIITFRFTATGGTPGAPDDRFVTVVTGAGV